MVWSLINIFISDFVAVLLSSVGLLLLYRCNRLPSQLYFEPCILWKSLSLISWLQPLSSAFYLESYFNFAMVALVSVYFSFSFRYSESKFVKTAAFHFLHIDINRSSFTWTLFKSPTTSSKVLSNICNNMHVIKITNTEIWRTWSQ